MSLRDVKTSAVGRMTYRPREGKLGENFGGVEHGFVDYCSFPRQTESRSLYDEHDKISSLTGITRRKVGLALLCFEPRRPLEASWGLNRSNRKSVRPSCGMTWHWKLVEVLGKRRLYSGGSRRSLRWTGSAGWLWLFEKH